MSKDMSETKELKDPNSLLVELAQRMAADAHDLDWQTIRLTVRAIASRSEFGLFAVFKDSQQKEERLKDDAGVVFPLLQLREILANEQTGAWYTAVARLNRDGNLDVSYDYQNEAAWDITPDEDAYLDDLKKFPRIAKQIPAWYPSTSNK